MSFTWATVDRDFSDRPHYLHKSLSHLWGRKIYYDFTKNGNEHALVVLKVTKSLKRIGILNSSKKTKHEKKYPESS